LFPDGGVKRPEESPPLPFLRLIDGIDGLAQLAILSLKLGSVSSHLSDCCDIGVGRVAEVDLPGQPWADAIGFYQPTPLSKLSYKHFRVTLQVCPKSTSGLSGTTVCESITHTLIGSI
jgi:hypothetical protein